MLGEIAEPSRERALPAEVPDMRYISLEHIEPQTMRLLGHGFARNTRSTSVKFSKDDVLYGKMRPYLNKVWVAEFDGICSTEFLVFPKQDGLDNQFFALRLNAEDFVSFANNQVSGERPRVDFKKLSYFPILLPPIAEQNRIVVKLNAALSGVERAEKAARRAQERLQRYCAAVLHAAVTGELTRDWREAQWRKERATAETGEGLLSRILKARREQWKGRDKYKEPVVPDSRDLPKLPEGWVWASPDQLSKFDDNAICAGPFGTIFKAKDFRPTGVPIIFLRHVAAGRYLTDKPGFMDKQKWEEFFRPYSVFGGELLITKLGEPPGVCAIYPEGIGPAMVTPDVIKFAVHEAAAVPKFLMHYFNSAKARQFSTGIAFGTTRLRLTLSLFREMPVALPPLAEQTQIVAEVERRLSAADRLAATLEQQLARTNATRQSLMSEAFSGRLSFQEPNEEPASVLLERIRAAREAEAQKPRVKRMPKPKSTLIRRPLLDVLRENKRPMKPEQLFSEAGFKPSQVDLFYRELVSLSDKLRVKKPQASEAKAWPYRAHVMLQLKEN